MNAAEEEAVTRRVAEAAAQLLASGQQGITVSVPELGETWAITRDDVAPGAAIGGVPHYHRIRER